ncbi:MAG: O-antigen ligase family protein [Chloroflexota bacterium]
MGSPSLKSWSVAGLCAVIGVVPWIFHPWGTLGFEVPKLVAVELLALGLGVAWAITGLYGATAAGSWWEAPRRAWLATSLVERLASALLGVVLLSVVTSFDPSASVFGSYDRQLGLIALAAVVFMGLLVARLGLDPSVRVNVLAAMVLGSLPVCAYGLAQVARIDPLNWLNRPAGVFSTLGSSTLLSTYLAMVIPITLALMIQRVEWRVGDRWITAALAALLPLQVGVLWFTGVRGGLFGAALAVALVTGGWLWRRNRRGGALASAAAMVVLVSVSVLMASRGRDAWQTEADGASGLGTGLQRTLVWQASVEAFARSPVRLLTGFGPETAALALEAVFPAEIARSYPNLRVDRAHNMVLDVLLGSGLAGLVGCSALVGAIILGVWRRWREEAGDGDGMRTGLLAGIAAWLLAGLFAFDGAATLVFAAVILGLLASDSVPPPSMVHVPARPARRRERARRRGVARSGVRAVVGVGFLLTVGSVWLSSRLLAPLISDVFYSRALALRAGEAPAASVGPLLSAVEWSPRRDVYVLALGRTYLDLAETASSDAPSPEVDFQRLFSSFPGSRSELFAAARASFRHAVTLSPLDPYAHYHLGRMLVVWASATRDAAERSALLDEAVASFDRAIELSPRRTLFRDAAAEAAHDAGRHADALARFAAAEALDGLAAERLGRMGEVLLVQGDLPGARASFARGLQLDPRSAISEHGLALLAVDEGRLQEAIERGQRATRLQMHNWRYYRDLAGWLRDAGDRSQALVAARAARRYAPAWEWEPLSVLVESLR